MNIFVIAAQDQSKYYLGYIFGSVGTVLTPGGSGVSTVGILSVLFKYINTSVLTLGAFLVIYTTVVGLLATAHEGEFMGKKWSGLWVPIRTVMGIALLFPVSSGYSAIQIVMMWIILQGVGMADVIWTTALTYVIKVGSPTAAISVTPSPGLTTDLGHVFQGLVCQASARAVPDTATSYAGIPAYADTYVSRAGAGDPVTTHYYYCGPPINSDDKDYTQSLFCTISSDAAMFNVIPSSSGTAAESPQVSASDGTIRYNFGPDGSCGYLTYPDPSVTCKANPSTLKCVSQTALQTALQTIIPTLGVIAKKIVSVDHEYMKFHDTIVPANTDPSPPAWVQNFCSDNQILPQDCCYLRSPFASSMPGFGVGPLLFPVPCAHASSFPNDVVSGDNGSATNTDTAAMKMYLKYAITPYLNETAGSTANNDFIKAAGDQYTKIISDAVNAFLLAPASADLLKGTWAEDAQSMGWLYAGGYYYKLSKWSNSNNDQANPTLTVVAPRMTGGNAMYIYRNNYTAVGDLLSNIKKSQPTALSSSLPPELGSIGDVAGGVANSLLAVFMECLTGNGSYGAGGGVAGMIVTPLQNLAHFGYILLILSQLFFFIIAALVTVLMPLGSLNFIALGFGLTSNPIQAMLQGLLLLFLPLIYALIGAMFMLGATLGVYIPLIPYVIFTMGAVGWFVAVIEAMVAAPLIALGILSPGGQHEILGRAEHALMMVLNLFLRPGLMVFGMFAAMLLSSVVVTMINHTFLAVVGDIMGNPGLFEQMLFIAAYTSLIITALNKTFSLIYLIPERITTWIGGQAVSYGEQEALGHVKQAVEGAGGQVTSGAQKGGESLKGGIKEAQKDITEGTDKAMTTARKEKKGK